jgi:hypothetical protein
VIDQNPTYTFSSEAFGATTTDTQGSGDGTYYIHVQAKTLDQTSAQLFIFQQL